MSIHLSICVSVRDSLSHAYVGLRSIARREPRRLPACLIFLQTFRTRTPAASICRHYPVPEPDGRGVAGVEWGGVGNGEGIPPPQPIRGSENKFGAFLASHNICVEKITYSEQNATKFWHFSACFPPCPPSEIIGTAQLRPRPLRVGR